MRQCVTTAVCVAVLAGSAAGWCFYRAQGLHREAEWLMARGSAQAAEYAHSLDDTLAAQELETFARRRAAMEQAHRWERGQAVGVVLAALAALAAWVLFLLQRLGAQFPEPGEEPEPSGGKLAPVPAPVRSQEG